MSNDRKLFARHNGLRFAFGSRPTAEDERVIALRYNRFDEVLEALKQQHWALIGSRRSAIESDNPRCFVTEHDTTNCPTCKLIAELEAIK